MAYDPIGELLGIVADHTRATRAITYQIDNILNDMNLPANQDLERLRGHLAYVDQYRREVAHVNRLQYRSYYAKKHKRVGASQDRTG